MAVLSIVEVPDQRLRTVCEAVSAVDDAVRTLAADMIETMYAAKGIGLAAPQVAVLRRVVVIDLQERGDSAESEVEEAGEGEGGGERVRDPHVYINPEIIELSEDLSTYNEGCLSIPEQYAEVERPARCRVRWLDEQGAAQEAEFDGLMATCMQHEIDHLNGVLFIDHITRLKREMLLRKLAKARKASA